MNLRIPTVLVAAVVAIAATVFTLVLVRAVFYAPEEGVSIPSLIGSLISPPNVAESSSTPVRLQIPSLSINARVEYVGLNWKGDMAVPSTFKTVGWYKDGTVPGQLGSAAIDGHVDNGLGLAGVFKHLGDMEVGDDVYIVTKDGSKLHFVVQEIETYPYTEGPAERIFNANDAARLNLITCTGAWLPGKRTYTERLVVYTTFVGTVPSDE